MLAVVRYASYRGRGRQGHRVALPRRARAAAGAVEMDAPSQIYVHTSGDSWDYLVINPMTTPAEDDAIDAAAKKMGIVTGPKASLQFRTMIGSHTDTLSDGPMTAAEIIARIEK
jgi:hypothetical protein